LEKLNASLIKLGYAPYETIDKDLGIVAFKLKKTYTKQEVQEFKDLEAKCFDSIRTIAVPRNMNLCQAHQKSHQKPHSQKTAKRICHHNER